MWFVNVLVPGPATTEDQKLWANIATWRIFVRARGPLAPPTARRAAAFECSPSPPPLALVDDYYSWAGVQN